MLGACRSCGAVLPLATPYCDGCYPRPAEGGAACAVHPDRAAPSSCPRCGTFVCEGCRPPDHDRRCPSCERKEAPARARRTCLWVAPLPLVLVGVFHGWVLLASWADPAPLHDGYGLLFVVTTAPFVAVSALVAAVRRPWSAWVACVPMAAFVLLLFLSQAHATPAVLVLCLPVVAAVTLALRAGRLAALARSAGP